MTALGGDELVAVIVRVSGRVQGVFFRAATRETGARLGLRGWVRNRADGSVEAFVQGPAAAVAAMVDWCGEGPEHAQVDALTSVPATVDPALTSFSIRP